MKPSRMRPTRTLAGARKGAALIVTLALLSLMTILLVGLVSGMRVEVASAHAHLSGVQARLLAMQGLDMAASRIDTATPGVNPVWISAPGAMLGTGTNGSTNAYFPMTNAVDLSSGAAGGSTNADEAVNLNAPLFTAPSQFMVSSTNLALYARWIYIRKDGTCDTNAPAAFNAANPVVGRFAFWGDDASARLNWNTAWTRDASLNAAAATNALGAAGDPSGVGLGAALSASDVAAVQAFRFGAAGHLFNSFLDPLAAGGGVSNAVAANRMGLTPYSLSPDLNLFGQPRIVLTTSTNLANGNPCLNILAPGQTDPGNSANLDAAKVNAAVMGIYNYLVTTNWPMTPGKSFAGKYAPPAHPERVVQLAVDIVDYVRCAESPAAAVDPLRGLWTNNAFSFMPGGSSGGSAANGTNMFLGNTRRPCITEIGAWMPATPSAVSDPGTGAATNGYVANFKIELYLPPGFHAGSVNLGSVYLLPTVGDPGNNGSYVYSSELESQIKAAEVTAGTVDTTLTLHSGEYKVVTRSVVIVPGTPGARPITLYMRPSIGLASYSRRLEIVPASVVKEQTDYLIYTVDAAGVAEAGITTLQSDDPAVNSLKGDWVQAANTLGAANGGVSTLGKPTTAVPPQDTDAGGAITSAGMQFPPPKGATGNAAGMVGSVGELGFIHSGIECAVPGYSKPWRTIRLQPQGTTNSVPDWALADLFAAPFSVTGARQKAVLQPYPLMTGGRININSAPLAFTNSVADFAALRGLPLEALFLGAVTNGASAPLDTNGAAILAGNVLGHVLAPSGSAYANTNFFYTPGQLAEVKGVADQGKGSEALLRQVLGAATTQGGTFLVYSVGQSLKQLPGGSCVVLGEQRYQALFECVPQAGAAAATRLVLLQELNP